MLNIICTLAASASIGFSSCPLSATVIAQVANVSPACAAVADPRTFYLTAGKVCSETEMVSLLETLRRLAGDKAGISRECRSSFGNERCTATEKLGLGKVYNEIVP